MPDEFQIDAALTPALQPSQGRHESNDAALTEDLALAQLEAHTRYSLDRAVMLSQIFDLQHDPALTA